MSTIKEEDNITQTKDTKEINIENRDEYIDKLELEIADYKKDIESLKAKNAELNDKIIENNELMEKYELESNLKDNDNKNYNTQTGMRGIQDTIILRPGNGEDTFRYNWG